MAMTSPETMAIVGALLALWLAVAGWAIVRGIMMQRAAAFSARKATQLAALLDCSPSLPLIVRSDGRIEGPGGIAQLFGLETLPATISGLANGGPVVIEPAGMDQLMQEIVAAQRTSKSFAIVLKSVTGGKALRVRGVPAPPQLNSSGSALLWITDASDSEAKANQLRQQREDAIAAFEAISSLIEAAPFPMWFRDSELRLALVNQAYVRSAEADSAQDVVARQVELVEPIAGQSAQAAAQAAHDSAESVSRFIPVTIAGSRRMMQVVDVPIADVGVAGYAIDRQELEDARSDFRRFSEARRSMLDQMSAAVAEFAPDRSLRFANRPFLRLFLLDEEWAATAPPFERLLDRLRDNSRTPEVRDFPGWRAERRGWFAATGMIEESWLLRDGTHLRAVAQPAPDGGLLLIFEDRTEQIRLASARDTLLRVRTATFDNLFEAVAVFAPDGKLNLWNQRFRRLWDVSEEFLVGHPRIDALLDKIGPRLEDPRQQSVLRQMIVGATGERQQRSGRIGFKGGQQFDFAAIPLPDGNALFTLIDVTDSRKIERALRDRAEALEAADRVKTDFLSRISYELRTPLTSIGGFAEMLNGGYAGDLPDAAKDYVKAILSSTEALGQQIDTVLDLAQSEAGTMPLERRPIALGALLRDAVAAAQPDAKAAGVELVTDIRVGLGQIDGDAKRLRQVVDHMISHAISAFGNAQHQPEGGRRVLVHGDGNSSSAQLVVSDNGQGSESSGTQAVAMALARQLVQAHDGRFDLVRRPSEGSMTAVFLPR
ncbi:histidine kinase [Sphingomonas lacunae]|uniref:histidine kinase n=2 Tax=Sphingomonas lacunae TaxID=2698828 RepID=A0A6M4AVC0_9SPHN|nr:PAS domain-containing sensor histidine kinase [Sphingomonas lacunae]QJQ33014.1 histidine kinase [Sphingomonas lacunae]